ncbi:ATP synthase F0 subunit C [Mycoplasma miroungirhinis]|uniref:ATP synthase subunit c n=1 Tax=Mycoplasma miroungirhinis TaxID=754516 RepID=A0A6M4JD23_9MOLU|nr:ATP synthase F0 subunit C [Mycoplasma miroungirhinis]QJR44245.1 ATP synthase F0 subunit C [Mycoplasma miroungirhinis]
MNTDIITSAYNASNVTNQSTGLAYGLALVGAGLAMIGAGGAGIGQGITVGKTVEAIGRNPEVRSRLLTTMFIGLSVIETCAIYCLVISFLIIFV